MVEAVALGGHDFERKVVLKQLLDAYLGDEKVVHAFIDEARIVGQLSHPNIVGILDFGMLDDRPFQVLEHVDGLDLDEIAKLTKKNGVSFPVEVALHISIEVARALEYAHGAIDREGRPMEIIHRDVTPANVLISWNGDVKLADFGVARAKRRIEETQVGLTKGTFAFMSPEQARADAIDARADLFSLGCLLHWMLAGHSPIERDTIRLKVTAGGEALVDAKIPADIAQIVRKATRSDRTERFSSAADLADAAWPVLLAHAKQDVRRATRNWLHKLRPEAPAKPQQSPMAQLFDVRLLGSVDAPVRRYASVARSPETVEMVGGGEPGLAFRDAGTEVVPDSLQAETIISGPSVRSGSGDPSQDLVRLSLELAEATRNDRNTPPISDPGDSTLEIDKNDVPGSGERASPDDALIGQTVEGYRILRIIGKGGWSTVYLARSEKHGVDCALKVLSPQATTEVGTKRLQREAKVMSQVRHPNVAQVFDFGSLPNGRPFLAMELLRGRTLYSLIMESAPFPAARVVDYARQIARGLGEANRLGLVHRDLKPANIMVVEEQGRHVLKILDFGIARTVDAAVGETRLTANDRLLGTPTYMAPEQILSPSNVTHGSDLYSLGIVMYRMLERTPPFEGSRSEVVEKQLHTEPPSLEVHGELGQIVADLLSKRPEDRPRTADEVLDRLAGLGFMDTTPAWALGRPSLDGPIPEFTDTHPPPTSVLPPSAAASLSGAVLLFALTAIAAVLGYIWWSRRPPEESVILPPPPRAPTVEVRPSIEVLEPQVPLAPTEETTEVGDEPSKKKKKGRRRKVDGPGSPDILALEARFRSDVASNGLVMSDLDDPSIAPALADWKAAIAERSPERAEAALAVIEPRLVAIAGQASTVERKKDRVYRRLEQLAAKAGEPGAPPEAMRSYKALEDRYLLLRKSFAEDASPDAVRVLCGELSRLEREIGKALDSE